jgi:hypothetical protein
MNTIKPGKRIEELMEGAIARGEFENLKGRGKPLNLDAHFDTPEDVRVGHSLLKSAGFLPEELELRAVISCWRRNVWPDETKARAAPCGWRSTKRVSDSTSFWNDIAAERGENSRKVALTNRPRPAILTLLG